MHLHEYQAKQLLARFGVPIPAGRTITALDELDAALAALPGDAWMVKAQVHAGGRGKAGGVKRVQGAAAARSAVSALLGGRLVTAQTDARGQPVSAVLLETPGAIARELYLACLVDRSAERVALIAAAAGGMDIEAVAARDPHAVLKVFVDPVAGLQPYQCRELAFALALKDTQIAAFTRIASALYRAFVDCDLSLVEINPLAVMADGNLLALDAKADVDDNALYRQAALAPLRDASQEDAKEIAAKAHDLNYIALRGDIGCMVNGAGLAMATMDLIQLHGGAPANFLDVGGGTTAAKVAQAFKLICADEQVRAILVNIFGGIVRCDLIAEGIIAAVRETGVNIPVVVRLVGTRADEGRALLAQSGLTILPAASLTEAAQAAVAAARGRARVTA